MSEPRKLITGDVVTLNSGGPSMTVYALEGEKGIQPGWLECTWFNSDAQPLYCGFPETALMLIVGEDE